MKKLAIVFVLAAIGAVLQTSWQRSRKEEKLGKQVEELLASVPYNARNLSAQQWTQLSSIVKKQGFTLDPQQNRFETHLSQFRPDGASPSARYTDHMLRFSYTRPNAFLPFLDEQCVTVKTALVLVPAPAPRQATARAAVPAPASAPARRAPSPSRAITAASFQPTMGPTPEQKAALDQRAREMQRKAKEQGYGANTWQKAMEKENRKTRKKLKREIEKQRKKSKRAARRAKHH